MGVAIAADRVSAVQRWLWPLALIMLMALGTIQATQAQEFLPPDEAFKLDLGQQDNELIAHFEVTPGYYLYRERLSVETADGAIEELNLPDGDIIEDEYFGRSEVYHRDVTLRAALDGARSATLTWQGCAEAGLCYPPQRRSIELDEVPEASDALLASPANGSNVASDEGDKTSEAAETSTNPRENTLGEDQRLAAQLADGQSLWFLAAFFGMGLLLTFTPCVLPMIPILSSLVVGSQRDAKHPMLGGLVLSLAFVIPMALTYSLLGVAAALAGANLQALFQNPIFIGIFAGLFVVLALAMFGLFELNLPTFLRNRLGQLQQHQHGGHLGGAAAMGVLSALLVGPCMTAPLAGALLYIAESGDAWQGGLALLALGLGMGAPLLLVGMIGPRLLPRPGSWMIRVRALFGFVLLGMAIWFADRVLPGSIVLGLWGALIVSLALALWQMAKTAPDEETTPLAMISRSAGAILGLWGIALIVGAAGGSKDPFQPLAFLAGSGGGQSVAPTGGAPLPFETIDGQKELQARLIQASNQDQWTLLEFTADWCISCEVIEKEVFGDSRVQQALAQVQRLSEDVTKNTPTDQAIMRDQGVLGPPTLMLFGPDGEERRDLRVIGELSAEEFLERLEQARDGLSATGDPA
ncbi:protein-disulfide reductase DsbD [Pistricoccus aurantiacus]|uniref:protein-disulfide reductase DsbD n=1 Tax=Pistricoccus aurantiacus TaxID=1883414 RepID=UPI00363C5538